MGVPVKSWTGTNRARSIPAATMTTGGAKAQQRYLPRHKEERGFRIGYQLALCLREMTAGADKVKHEGHDGAVVRKIPMFGSKHGALGQRPWDLVVVLDNHRSRKQQPS